MSRGDLGKQCVVDLAAYCGWFAVIFCPATYETASVTLNLKNLFLLGICDQVLSVCQDVAKLSTKLLPSMCHTVGEEIAKPIRIVVESVEELDGHRIELVGAERDADLFRLELVSFLDRFRPEPSFVFDRKCFLRSSKDENCAVGVDLRVSDVSGPFEKVLYRLLRCCVEA